MGPWGALHTWARFTPPPQRQVTWCAPPIAWDPHTPPRGGGLPFLTRPQTPTVVDALGQGPPCSSLDTCCRCPVQRPGPALWGSGGRKQHTWPPGPRTCPTLNDRPTQEACPALGPPAPPGQDSWGPATQVRKGQEGSVAEGVPRPLHPHAHPAPRGALPCAPLSRSCPVTLGDSFKAPHAASWLLTGPRIFACTLCAPGRGCLGLPGSAPAPAGTRRSSGGGHRAQAAKPAPGGDTEPASGLAIQPSRAQPHQAAPTPPAAEPGVQTRPADGTGRASS